MYRLAFIAAILVIFSSISSAQGKVVLGVFAHPDDENFVGAVLAKYARLDHKVFVVIATDGKDGNHVTKIPAGDELGRIRRLETTCACEKLGIQKPIFLSLDRLDTKIGVRAYLNAHTAMKEMLKAKIVELKPDVILAFGPDGEYGHSEHIVAGAVVQELLLREGWVDKYPLYFPTETKQQVGDDEGIGYVDPRYVNLSIKFSDADKEKYIEAAKCYVTQYTEEGIAATIADARENKLNTTNFRRFSIERSRGRTRFFD